MKVEFLKTFSKDLDNIKVATVKQRLESLIENLEAASQLNEIPNTKKLKGHKSAYRIKLGDYRVGIFLENDTVEMARVAHRKDIYSLFP